ncbi:16S rRNA (guanine(527)-N(7))-methyltransferase RsmG [Synechococcus elongatus]|uniref:Ribosomal RNA small subunit methyltransferase G n=1 Tax=Synechococcus elongatus PCC 11801 TaxID=2219813 RepID=A0AAN1QKW6_SYNEL|nr:16S rRNA (guanine(527)-N(7))-methyltransferase RsmG [Synechococcus elongatus]AZB71391.1 16S rRNA (guanine(527)-N(7))-methyltransferase RsmG [Synechococcus elongatus PCC 11801]
MTSGFLLDVWTWAKTLGWQPSAQQQQQFEALYHGIVAGNQRLNLTRITDPAEFTEKHLWDSLYGLRPLLTDNWSGEIIDIGTGGGFPGLPAAIALPQSQVTLLDSTRKKIQFLQTLAQDLGLANVTAQVGRAEEWGRDRRTRARYDWATIRAVGPATVCAEYCLPLLKIGGKAVLYRGQWTEEEAIALDRAVAILGGKVVEVAATFLPESGAERHCITLQKTAQTPAAYPRMVGLPSQKPLG